MAGKKSRRTSPKIQQAEIQLAAVNRINPNLPLGKGASPETYAQAIAEAQQQLERYHEMVEAVEAQRIALKEAEKKVHAITVRVLSAVGLEFGKESPEYSMVGGVRPSEIKRNPPAKKDDDQAA